ncbi:MAG: glycoside hydrolase family 25 protein [Actinobacteria bacterium]|nr:glycoside hydrolase family 25 protein [Actinomycetota bacterium]
MKRSILALFLGLSLISHSAFASAPASLVSTGPGARIHGVDISRWQHPNEKTINFTKMAESGVRFVFIKGSDGHDPADSQAKKYLLLDRPAAQAAGLYTGFYHYAYLPDTTNTKQIVTDAKAQAQKVIWRLASIGGYTNQDLPVALDIENNCVRSISGVCKKYMNKKYVTLWAQTWLDEVASKTNRKPMVYSYPQFLQTAMLRSAELAKYPLWIAAYGKDPAVATNSPGMKKVGCFAHSWTKSNCSPSWQVWQYTSCGIGSKYGLPTARVDLNVFSGSEEKFLALTNGLWQPEAADMLPFNETTTMQIVSSSFATTNDVASFVIDVFRPDGTPVVTGDVAFKSADSLMSAGTQSVLRSGSGRWTLNISMLQAGTYVGYIQFTDESQVHAPSIIPVQFEITQGQTPSPKPSSKPTKKPVPAPVDQCKGQIRN